MPESTGGQFLFPPKQGESMTVTIAGAMERVQNQGGGKKQNYSAEKDDKDYGYYDTLPVMNEEGEEVVMKVSTWAVYFAIKEVNDDLNIGDEILIDHPARGEYKITKV